MLNYDERTASFAQAIEMILAAEELVDMALCHLDDAAEHRHSEFFRKCQMVLQNELSRMHVAIALRRTRHLMDAAMLD